MWLITSWINKNTGNSKVTHTHTHISVINHRDATLKHAKSTSVLSNTKPILASALQLWGGGTEPKNNNKMNQLQSLGVKYSSVVLIIQWRTHTSLVWEWETAASRTTAHVMWSTISARCSRSTAEKSTLRWVYTAERWRTSSCTCESHWGPSHHPRERGTDAERQKETAWADIWFLFDAKSMLLYM